MFGKMLHKLWGPSRVDSGCFPMCIESPLMCSIIWMSGNNVPHALSTPVPPYTNMLLPRWVLPESLWHMRVMFSTCQGIIRNRDDSPGANGERWMNIFMFWVIICCILFVIMQKKSPQLIYIIWLKEVVQERCRILSGFCRILFGILWAFLFYCDIKKILNNIPFIFTI